jgi:hypothetical protein
MKDILLNQLIDVYEKHGKIIIGVDFDDTVFPFNKSVANINRCNEVVEIVRDLKPYSIICLWSVADAKSLVYKEHIMDLYGIKPDYVNDSPLNNWGDSKKVYFNIQLDDKAGLNETLQVLKNFKRYLLK